jgi:hypothetical protein
MEDFKSAASAIPPPRRVVRYKCTKPFRFPKTPIPDVRFRFLVVYPYQREVSRDCVPVATQRKLD